MTPRDPGRVRDMSAADVQVRADAARRFLEVAEMVAEEADTDYRPVSASLAVLAGIAASDAICGHVLKKRSRAQEHRQAVDLLRTVRGAGGAARALDRLLDIKDAAQYGTSALSADRTRGAVKAAATVVDEMESILRT